MRRGDELDAQFRVRRARDGSAEIELVRCRAAGAAADPAAEVTRAEALSETVAAGAPD
jgi:hypothetical protein